MKIDSPPKKDGPFWTHLYFWLLELLFLHKSTAEEELDTKAEGESVLEEAILHIYATT